MASLAGIFADGAIWHVGGRGRLAGEKRGREAAFAYFAVLGETTAGIFRAEMHDVAVSGEHVVGVHTTTAKRGDRALNVQATLVFHLEEGKIVEAWEQYADSQ